MKIQSLFVAHQIRRYLIAILALISLAGCDIQPVAVGTWDVRIDNEHGTGQETWTITEAGQITIARDASSQTLEVELAGSRVSWSNTSNGADSIAQVNFSGTVNGNELQGTLFSQQGNRTVIGTRR